MPLKFSGAVGEHVAEVEPTWNLLVWTDIHNSSEGRWRAETHGSVLPDVGEEDHILGTCKPEGQVLDIGGLHLDGNDVVVKTDRLADIRKYAARRLHVRC